MLNKELKDSFKSDTVEEGKEYNEHNSVCPVCNSNDVWERDSDWSAVNDVSYCKMECLTCSSIYYHYTVEVCVGTEVIKNNCGWSI